MERTRLTSTIDSTLATFNFFFFYKTGNDISLGDFFLFLLSALHMGAMLLLDNARPAANKKCV